MSTIDIADDEMEAMMREIESMGMAPGATTAATADEDVMTTAEALEVVKTMEKLEAAETTAKKAAPKKVVAPAETVKEAASETVKAAEAPTPDDPDNRVAAVKAAVEKSPPVRRPEDDLIDHEQVKKDIAINPTDLDTDLIQHPSMQLHYALKTADARRAFERMKSAVEILEARLDAEYREKLADGAGKKPTEAAIRNALVADKQYSSAQSKLIDAQHLWKMCEAIESSFHSRKDILLEVARDRRKEKEGALRVMEDSGLRERVADVMKKSA